jgi:triphosphatase
MTDHTPCDAAINATPFVLSADLSVEQGLQIIVGNCLTHIQGNLPGVRQTGDIEYVHQMRIGLRRLRSALQIFDEVRNCPTNIQSELAWLTDQLGNARDWDVLGTFTLPALADKVIDLPGLDQLQKQVQQVARRKRQRCAAAVDSTRSARLWGSLENWLEDTDRNILHTASSIDCMSMPLPHFATRVLPHYQRKLRARYGAMEPGDPHSRHRVRISAKKLRYAAEFFQSYYSGKSAHRFITRLAALQDALGISNDTTVAEQLLRDLPHKLPDLVESCAYARGYLAASDASRLVHLEKLIHRFTKLKKLRQRALSH